MKTVVITGTSRGIGLQLALLFADAGHKVLALSRKPHQDLNSHENISFFSIDFTAENGLQSFDGFLQMNPITIDILIHNAGQLITKPFTELTNADFESVYKVNVFGVAELTRICLPYMIKGSHMVSVSSMGGIQGSMKFPGLAAYSSSKGAVITLTEMLAEEYKEAGISFNVLALGAVQTEMLAEAFPGYIAPVSAQEMAGYIMDFSLNAHKFYNGKVLQVSATTP